MRTSCAFETVSFQSGTKSDVSELDSEISVVFEILGEDWSVSVSGSDPLSFENFAYFGAFSFLSSSLCSRLETSLRPVQQIF